MSDIFTEEAKTYDIILFDLDGTLTDPKEGIINSIKYALSKYGIEENDDKYLEKFIGPSLYESFKVYYSFDEKEVYNVVNYYREYFSERGMYENKLYPGIKELLNSLKEKDKTLIVATSKPTVFAKEIIKYFGLDEYFVDVFGSNLDGTRIAKSEVINAALSSIEYNTSSANAGKNIDPKKIMIGDREYDIIGAKENGIDSVGVLYGYGSKDELEAVGPEYITDQVSVLKDVLLE